VKEKNTRKRKFTIFLKLIRNDFLLLLQVKYLNFAMSSKSILKTIGISLILLINIGCDQISKDLVRRKISYNQTFGFIDNHLTLTKVENTGAFLSVGSSLPDFVKFILLSGIPLLVLAFGIVYLFTRKHLSFLSRLALSFAIGGGIGNIHDRIMYGSVTDFLHIDFGIFQTGIFNMADVSIMVGMILFVIQSFQKKRMVRN
jgi:signal peptidase II